MTLSLQEKEEWIRKCIQLSQPYDIFQNIKVQMYYNVSKRVVALGQRKINAYVLFSFFYIFNVPVA